MIILDGKSLSAKLLSSLSFSPEASLHIVLVGDDPSSVKYVSLKEKKCREIGLTCVIHRLAVSIPESDLHHLISKLNSDPMVTGFIIQLPLPSRFNKDLILSSIAPNKDVDGLNPNSGITPAAVRGIIILLSEYRLSLNNKNIVIINDSDLIGQPLRKYFSQFTPSITLLNEQSGDLKPYTQKADILISATGVKNLVTADMVKDGAVVIDVANGDVDFAGVSPKCSYITPTFGGVGPMTIASLLFNTYDLAAKNL